MKRIRLHYKKIFLRILFIMFIIFVYLFFKYKYLIMGPAFSQLVPMKNASSNYDTTPYEYDVIASISNPNYNGIGQKKVSNKDGYTSTFTTIDNKIYIEYKQNGNASWSSNSYWDNTMETDGCGITALSIILSGYGKNFTPENLRQKFYPLLKSDNMSYHLYKSFGVKNTDFYFDSVHLSNEYLEDYLNKNKPILICVWNQLMDNRWTRDSHYMVLLATDGNGMVYVSNPNGLDDTYKASGWYDINEITPYIAKALFIE